MTTVHSNRLAWRRQELVLISTSTVYVIFIISTVRMWWKRYNLIRLKIFRNPTSITTLITSCSHNQSPNTVVGIQTRLRNGGTVFKFRQVQEMFRFPNMSRLAPGITQPPTQWVSNSSPEVKWPRPETDSSPPPSTEVKNERSSSVHPPIAFITWTVTTSPFH